ncbi:MAG: GYDIA family GHMP kinase [Salinimicrobium sediminis]|nr:GYDIA family GHMP kinase [Salinimicrobium sediminis]
MQKFHSHGKLLITGEYVVLDGAVALALPTKFGQQMEVTEIPETVIEWKSLDREDKVWFEDSFRISDLYQEVLPTSEVSKMLFLALRSAAKRNPQFFKGEDGYQIITKTDFPREWGLGTSSTLIANLAKWTDVDAFELLETTFGGSGYDVAVALQGSAITYRRTPAENVIFKTTFDPLFKDRLFFVFLNRKQNSRESIVHYRQQEKTTLDIAIEKISNLTQSILTCTTLAEFELLIEVHESIISTLTGLKKVKNELFPDYPGAVKSLGGWGGDFVLATGSDEDMEYFRKKGYSTILSFEEMILSN